MAELLNFPNPTAPSDGEARAQALDIRRSFIVEAPAGSGKTGLLIQRYLKLLADESVTQPEQVLAITFTNKATAELRERVLHHLEQAAATATPPHLNDFDRQTLPLAQAVLARDHQLGWHLLDHPHRLPLRTIDSVSAEIARTLPILSGSGGRLTPTETAAPLHREAARRTLLQLGAGDAAFDHALRTLLLHRDGNLAECELLIANMLALRDQWGSLIPLTQPELDDAWLDANVLPRLNLALDQAICSALTHLTKIFPPHLLDELTALASDFGHHPPYDTTPSPVALCAGLRTAPEAVSAHLERWRAMIHLLLTADNELRKERGITGKNLKFDYNRKEPYHSRLISIIDQLSGHEDLLSALCDVRNLPPAQYPEDQWLVAKSLFRILSRALVELQLVFAAHGQSDFTELSLLARHALAQESGPEDLASALGARLQHLLVDEMQDTSTPQYDLIQRLTASWDGHSQTVFLVGDPRQSIYLFRQARVERFLQAIETRLLGDLPLHHLRLTANFRSQSTLVEQFNQNFNLIFPPSPNIDTLPYTPASPTLPPSPTAAATVWHTQLLPTAEPQIRQQQSRREAGEILAIARSWLSRPLPSNRTKPWSLAILVRSRNHLDEIVSALRQQAADPTIEPIPFRAVEIESLHERQEILDLTALTRALLHPADRVAALAVLRAPWCGLSLADLHTLTGSDDPILRHQAIARLMAERGHLLSPDACDRMTRIWTVLQSAAQHRARLTTAQLVERAWLTLGGDTWLTPTQLTNTRRFFDLLDQLEAESPTFDPALLESRLRILFAEPDPIPPHTPFLELLTIHKAKGLEWDVVLIPALEKSIRASRTPLLAWSELTSPASPSTAAHIMLAPIPGKGEASKALNAWLNCIHKSREAAETKRLFYVACTRARQELHLFAAPPLTSAGTPSLAADSLLKAAWPAAEPHFATAATFTIQPITTQTWAQSIALETHSPAIEPESLALAAAAEPHQSSFRPAEPQDPSFQPASEPQESSFRPASGPESLYLLPPQDQIPPIQPKSAPMLQRLPQNFDPTARFTPAEPCHSERSEEPPYFLGSAITPDAGSLPTHPHFSRPEGSYAARSFGNTIHALLDLLSTRLAQGDPPATLLAEIPTWTPRISALLRADGLPRPTVDRLTREARTAITQTLRDPDGLWLLAPHPNSSSEYALTASEISGTPPSTIRPVSVRIDRIFEAGPAPHAPTPASGETHLWIVDYKTSSPGARSLEDFLATQRTLYGPQLETYARILGPARAKSPTQIRLALYFPTIPHLLWWHLIEEPKT